MKGILLINLGSPKSLELKSVRTYLKEFLSDDLVIDLPKIAQQLLVNLIIVPFRSSKTLHAYSTVWTDQGSPLIIETQAMARALQTKTRQTVEVAMRYQEPSIRDAIKRLIAKGVDDVHVLPLYPHYAMSTSLTTQLAVEAQVKDLNANLTLSYTDSFYNAEGYIKALAEKIKAGLPENYDYLLFSYHGLPERHLVKTDPTHSHCTKVENCCELASQATPFCYKAQVLATSRLCAEYLQLPADKWGVAFQSRIGPGWLQPFTDEAMKELPAKGKKNVAVVCPSFVADCLETLEEVSLRAHEDFVEAGGEQFTYIPCLNDDSRWIDYLTDLLVPDDQRVA
ncbi:MAG: ferrochelatase [Candidatus Azotimanducaceae bacterium]|jgi:ferrochelatase